MQTYVICFLSFTGKCQQSENEMPKLRLEALPTMIPLNLFFPLVPWLLPLFSLLPPTAHRPALGREKGPVQKGFSGLVALFRYGFKKNKILKASVCRPGQEGHVWGFQRPRCIYQSGLGDGCGAVQEMLGQLACLCILSRPWIGT